MKMDFAVLTVAGIICFLLVLTPQNITIFSTTMVMVVQKWVGLGWVNKIGPTSKSLRCFSSHHARVDWQAYTGWESRNRSSMCPCVQVSILSVRPTSTSRSNGRHWATERAFFVAMAA